MKKYLIIISVFMFFIMPKANANLSKNEAIDFFNKYVEYANSYNEGLLDMYTPDAKIVREVIKPTGETEQVLIPTKRFFKELKIGQKTAKLRRYKNKYRNIQAQEVPNGIKISAERQPAKETYWLKMYQIIQKNDSECKIKEEIMQTKVQTFLKQKHKGE